MGSEIDDDYLFGSGFNAHDQVVPDSTDIEQETSPPAVIRRERFRSTKFDECNESLRCNNTDPLDNNEVFDDSKTYISKFQYGSNSSIAARRSKSLPDLVLSSPECKERDEGICEDFKDAGPDVTSGHLKACKADDDMGILKDFPPKNQKAFRRSVSFQENPTKRSISPVDKTAAQKRNSYRKSSGYGTGDSKSSLQSSINSNTSAFSREESHDGPPSEQESKEKTAEIPILSIFEKSLVSSSCDQTDSTANQKETCFCNLPVFNKLLDNALSREHSCQSDSKMFVRYSHELPRQPTSKETRQNVSKLLETVDYNDTEKDQNCIQAPEEASPSLKIVRRKYCCMNSSGASTSTPFEKSPIPRFHTGEKDCDCGNVSDNNGKDQLNTLTEMLRHTDDIELQKVLLEHFATKMEGLNIEDSKASVLSDSSSASTPSPSEYRNNLSPGLKKFGEEQQKWKPQEDEGITAERVELVSRCRDHCCKNQLCNKVRMCIQGLETALENGWSSDIPLIKMICGCLWTHAKDCDDPEFTCKIMWCHHLSQHITEETIMSSLPKESDDSLELNDIRAVDDRSADDVFTILSHIYRTPVLTCSVIPSKTQGRFYKLTTTKEFADMPQLEIITSFGHFRNVFLSIDSYNPMQHYVLKRIMKDPDDDDTVSHAADVYKKLINLKHKHIVRHFWLAEYDQMYHVCMEFLKGGTLEECLEMTTITSHRGIIYMLQIIEAVLYLHKYSIIYLYWSCSNMLFMDTSRRHIKLSNLSLSVPEGKSFDIGKTKLSLPPCVVPPELTENKERVLRSLTDSWGAGCLFAEMLTGKQPWHDYRHKSREDLWKKISSGEELPLNEKQMKTVSVFEELLKSCWKRNPVDRISLEDMKQRLQTLVEHH